MRKLKWSQLMLSALIVLGLVSCSDWGAEDPPAGTDVYPTYSKVFSYGFNNEESEPTPMDLFSYTDGDGLPAVVNDELAGMVLYTADGCARFANPLNGSGLDKGVNGYAALTFLVKIPCITDEEGNPTTEYDRNAVLASFQSMDGKQKLNFDANGGLVYDGPDGDVSFNTDVKTGMLDNPGEWHSVAIQVTETGYYIYVDGKKKVNENSGAFDMKKVAAFMKNAPYIYINNGYYTDKTSSFYIDDFAFYRGKLKDADLKDKRPGAGGGDDDDPTKNWVLVGLEDNTTPWWSNFSDYFIIPEGETFHTRFLNYNGGNTNNWCNWLLAAANNKRDTQGYAEYFVLRSDNYGWGAAYDAANLSCDFNWDTFAAMMDGAMVDLTVSHEGDVLNVKALINGSNGETHTYTFSAVVGTEPTVTWLFAEGAHLLLDPEETYIGKVYESGSHLVGPADCSAGWWSSFSDYYKINANGSTTVKFINNQKGNGSNWNNWLLVTANTERGGDGYHEYFVLRSDAYGWGDGNYDAGKIVAGFNWDTYVADMHGATCYVKVERSGESILMTALEKTAANVWMPNYSFTYQGCPESDLLHAFFTVELASLDVLVEGTWPYFDKIHPEE